MSDMRSDVRAGLGHGPLAVAGFSLIELMVVVVILSVLAAIALPAYREHLMRAHIPEATSGLLLTAMRLEQHYQDNRSYLSGGACGVSLPPAGRFAFQCVSPADGQSFLLIATGITGELMQDFTYTLDQLGQSRTTALPAGWASAVTQECWIIRRGGTC